MSEATETPKKKRTRRGEYLPAAHRSMPHNLDAEKGLLCSILLKPDVLDTLGKFPPEIFYHPAHQEIFTALREMQQQAVPLDFITLVEFLKRKGLPENPSEEQIKAHKGLLDKAGGAAAISELFTFVPTAANADYYTAIVREHYLARRVIEECTPLLTRAYDFREGAEILDLLEEAETRLFSLRSIDRLEEDIKTSRQVMLEVIDAADQAYKKRGGTIGIPTGFTNLDGMLGGFMRQELILIAGRPSQGKSALAENMLKFQLLGGDVPGRNPWPGCKVGLFSLEMPAVDQGKRLVCDEANVELQRFRDGFFSEAETKKIMLAAERLGKTERLFIDDTPALTVQNFRAKARRMVRQLGVEIIYIDYLQLMRSSNKRVQGDKQAEIAEISTLLKQTARELDIPIVALAQLNRDAENREPTLANLRDSGQLEQDADAVIAIYRPNKGEVDPETGQSVATESATALVLKQRNGPIGREELRFEARFARFRSTTERLYSNRADQRRDKATGRKMQ